MISWSPAERVYLQGTDVDRARLEEERERECEVLCPVSILRTSGMEVRKQVLPYKGPPYVVKGLGTVFVSSQQRPLALRGGAHSWLSSC